MLQITNGQRVLEVTRGAFNNYFKRHGYHLVDMAETLEFPEEVATTPAPEMEDLEDSAQLRFGEDEIPEETEEETVDYSEIPLSELKFSDLCAYADQLGLDYDGITGVKAMRKLIRDHLEG